MTIFVLPLIVVEELDAITAAKKSTSLVRQRWGEATTLEIGFGALSSIAAVPLAGIFIASGFLQSVYPVLSITLMGVGIFLGVIFGLVFSALSGIAKAVLYSFATNRKIPDAVHKEILERTVVTRGDNGTIIEKHIQT